MHLNRHIPCRFEVVGAFLRREGVEECSDFVPKRLDGAVSGFFEQGFELGEDHFDGVEVRGVRRQIADGGADPFDGFAHVVILMAAEIVGNDDISYVQCRTEELAHVDEERFFVHGAVEHHRRDHGPHA